MAEIYLGDMAARYEINLNEESALARRLRRHGFIGREERGFQVSVGADDAQADVLIDAEA